MTPHGREHHSTAVLPTRLGHGTRRQCDVWCFRHQSQFHALAGGAHGKTMLAYGLKMAERSRVPVTLSLASLILQILQEGVIQAM